MLSSYADLTEINFSVGKLNNVRKFDASFFGITNEHGEYMDPLCRILLEKTYETICDAGLPVHALFSFPNSKRLYVLYDFVLALRRI